MIPTTMLKFDDPSIEYIMILYFSNSSRRSPIILKKGNLMPIPITRFPLG